MQQFLIIFVAMPLVASGNYGFLARNNMKIETSHADSVIKADSEAVPAPSMRGTAAKHILQKDRAVLEALNEETAKDTSAGVNLAQTRATIIPGRRRVHGGGADWTFPLVAGIAALAVAYSTVSQTPGGSAALALFEGQCMSSTKAD